MRIRVRLIFAAPLVALLFSPLAFADGGGYTWTNETPSGAFHNKQYFTVDSSATGQYVATVTLTSGDIYTSSDWGVTWTDRTPSGPLHNLAWSSIAVSANGQKLAAEVVNGDIYMSNDAGVTWTDMTASGSMHNRNYTSITMSSNGQVLSTIANNDIFTSSDGGTTWRDDNQSISFLYAITSSANGRVIYATNSGGGANGDVYKSADQGVTWTNLTPSGALHHLVWGQEIATSANGQVVSAVAEGNDIYTSTNGGTTWTDDTPSGGLHHLNWDWVAMSANGRVIAASVLSGDVYVSTDGGSTWTDTTPSGVGHNITQTGLAMSMTGQYIADVNAGGDIYTATNPGLPQVLSATPNNAVDSQAVSVGLPSTTSLTANSTVSLGSLGKTDGSYTYPLGLVNLSYITLDASDQVSLTFVTNLRPDQVVARDYNSSTQTFSTIPGAVITSTTYNGQPALRLTYTVTDNGSLDSDAVLNQVTDPVGLAELPASPNTGYGQPTSTSSLVPTVLALGSLVSVGLGLHRNRKLN